MKQLVVLLSAIVCCSFGISVGAETKSNVEQSRETSSATIAPPKSGNGGNTTAFFRKAETDIIHIRKTWIQEQRAPEDVLRKDN